MTGRYPVGQHQAPHNLSWAFNSLYRSPVPEDSFFQTVQFNDLSLPENTIPLAQLAALQREQHKALQFECCETSRQIVSFLCKGYESLLSHYLLIRRSKKNDDSEGMSEMPFLSECLTRTKIGITLRAWSLVELDSELE